MKQFIPIPNKPSGKSSNTSYSFSSCDACESRCCDSNYGTIYSQIVLEDFSNYTYFPLLFTFGSKGYIKPVLLLTNGQDLCRYIKDHKCTIYSKRPKVCQNYPLSPNIDNTVYIDLACPGISEEESTNNDFVENFKKDSYVKDYKDLFVETYFEFENLKSEDFTKLFTIRNIDFYAYTKYSENKYIKMHQSSLVHLEDEYFKNLK